MGLDRAKKVVNEKHERILLEMTKQPGNDICADCCAKAPRWASHSIGIFLCIRCGSIHRKMGTHISKVKSISLDSWTSDQVENMKQWGNLKANAKWNPRPDLNPVPVNATDNEMEKYIRNKYERKAFMEPKPPQPKNHSATRSSSAPSVSQTLSKRSDPPYKDRGSSTNENALRKLNDMGFTDNVRNREVLATTSGDINAAIEILCRLPGSSSSSDATKPTLTKSRPSTVSEDEKLTALWNLGFQDEAKNRDALRRTGGNVEVAAAILNDERSKPREKEPAAIVSTSSPGTPQQNQLLISSPAKKQLSSAQNQSLIDSPSMPTQSISPQQSATVNSIGLGVNNPFGLPQQQQQQQQLLQAQQQLQYKQQIQQQQQQQLQYQLLLQRQQQTSNQQQQTLSQQQQTLNQNRFDKNSILSLYNIPRTNSVPLGVSSLGGTNNNVSRSNSMPSNISSLSGISNITPQHNAQTTSGSAQNNHLNQIQPQVQQTTGYNSLTGVSAFGSMTPTNGLVGTPGLTGLGINGTNNQLFNSTPSPGLGISQSLGMSVMTPTQLNSNNISSIGITGNSNNNINSNAFGLDASLKQQNSMTGFTASSVSGRSTPFEDLISPFGGLSLQTQSPQQQPPSTSPALFGLSQPQTPQSQTSLGMFDIQQQRTATTSFLTGNNFLQPQQKTQNPMTSFGGGLLQPQRQQTQNTNSTWNNVNQFQGY